MNFSKCAFVFVVTLFSLHIQASKTIFLPKNLVEVSDMNPRNTIFLWDLHDVILKRDKKKTFGVIWRADKIEILRKSSFNLIGKMLGMIASSKTTSEELIHIIQHSNNPRLEALIYDVAFQYEPIEQTVHLIETLKVNGFSHYLGSNIGESIFKRMNDPEKHPKFASIFNNFNLDYPQTVTFDPKNPQDTIKKPDVRFFHSFLAKNKVDLSATRVIFIDDNSDNVRAARKAGMIGIQFINPAQLKADLKKLGILI